MSPSSPKQPTGFHILGKQSRRSACDRCRDQKLRCVYHDPRVLSCDRCQRFGVTCMHNHTSGKPSIRTGKRLSAIEGRKRRATVSPPTEKAKRARSTTQSQHASVDDLSSGSSTNNFNIDSPHDDWLLNLEFNEGTLSGADDALGPGSIDWDFEDCGGQPNSHNFSSDVDQLQTERGVCDGSTRHGSARPAETVVQKLHELDVRISQLMSVFESFKARTHSLFCDEWECKPMSEVLDVSQALLDLATLEPFSTDVPGVLLVATVYARLLGVYSELFAYMISGLGSSMTPGVDSLFPSPIEKDFGFSPSSDFMGSAHTKVDFQLVGMQVRDDCNLKLRIFVETCSYMLDKLEAQFRGSRGMTTGLCVPDATWEQTTPSPVSVLDIVAFAACHNNWSNQQGDQMSFSTITRNIQYLKQILKVV